MAGLRTLKARLTLVAITSLMVGIALISVLSLDQIGRDLLSQTQARELVRTADIAQDLSQRAVALQQMLRAAAEQVGPALERDDDTLEQHLLGQSALRQQYSNLFVAAPDGRMRLFIDEDGARRPGIVLADREYFRQVLAEKRPVISRAVPGRVSGEPVIVFAQPIVRGGEVTSVIGGAIRLSSRSLAASLLDRDSMRESDDLLVISDESGLLLAHPRSGLVLNPISEEPRLALALADWESKGSPAEPAGLLLHQPGEIVTAAGAAGTGWVVWRSLPEAALLAPLRLARWQALRHAAIVTVVLGVLTLLVVRRMLRPLQELEQRALHLFDPGRNIEDGWPETAGEVASLASVLRVVGAERARLESFTNELVGRLNSVMDAAPLGIGFTRHQRFELINPAWCRMLQRKESELLGRPAAEIFDRQQDYERLGPLVQAAFAETGQYAGEWRFRRRDGTVFWGQLSGRPVAAGQPAAGTIWTFADITDSRASREHLEWSATHDSLTGLANRAAFDARLAAAFGHPPAALILIDLDRFKPVNDTCGHAAGDAMLQLVARTLLTHVRAGDLAARTGGDEFAVVLERCPPEAAHRVAAAVQLAIAQAELTWEGRRLNVGASVGLASLTAEFTSADEWVAAADDACYRDKSVRRGQSTGNESLPPETAP